MNILKSSARCDLSFVLGGAYGYTLVKQDGSVSSVEVEGEQAKALREDLKRLNAAEVQARLDSK